MFSRKSNLPEPPNTANGVAEGLAKLDIQRNGAPAAEEIHAAEHKLQDEEDASEGNGGYTFDTPEHKEQLKAQRQQLWQWLKHVGSNMFKEGINLTKISLPVCLFEPRSFLERVTANWDYLDLLNAAADESNPVDRMKYVVAFALSGLCRQVSFHKPFNPILGETYQARYSNGTEIYCEQISHHPPISSWQVVEPSGKFVFFGNGNWHAGIKGNHVKGRQSGINCVRFSDGSTIVYELPGLTVKGVLWGQRCIKYGGEMKFVDQKNKLTCEVEVDPQPHQSWASSWFRSKKSCGYRPDLIRGTLKQGDKVLDTCHGNWLHHLDWEKGVKNGQVSRLWDIKRSAPATQIPIPDPLPSDAYQRKDLQHLKQGDQTQSQEWKHKLEERQRADQRLRKEGGAQVDDGHHAGGKH
ncbi:hypothetical protein DUNSADRAFT_5752 [Dunaliella salina]|uniref:Oxysterol-binding protein n=1 Tax=Dunaliella salina TaxID=3046 RepID=A0ABQ7H757_DUNSA|nr:hypothetical protein DUNSADRAFT_5752 [Dunaliella salina]|eukprot:KAF5842676.1 hypothetical protein DUNSADRAFT_5752 [Dunaliella salina]